MAEAVTAIIPLFSIDDERVQPHRIDVIHWIIVAVAKEIVIARVEQFRILAHEPAQAGMIRARTVFVKPKVSVVFASGEQEPVAVEGSLAHLVIGTVDRRLAKYIIPVILQDRRLPRPRAS